MKQSLELAEQDICDQISLIDTTSRNPSSTTLTPSRHGSTTQVNVSLSNLQTHTQFSVREKINGQHISPSTPSLWSSSNQTADLELGRARTLPQVPKQHGVPDRQRSISKRNFVDAEIAALTLDPEVVKKMRRWVLAIMIVDFDLDEGPTLTAVFPPTMLSSVEAENIAFSSFPDSPQFDQGSETHSFRFREQLSSGQPTTSLDNQGRPMSKDGFIYGFSHFTQKRDSNSKRGYMQRSLVVLTHLEYPAFFTTLTSTLGPLYQTHGITMLEAACHNIALWQDPTPGLTTELGFLGSVFHLEIPKSADEQQLTDTSSFNERYDARRHILGTSAPLWPPPLLLFEAALPNLWSIWECLLLGEPILVFGTSPAQTSQAVWWLRDLLRPIPLSGDIRPYFTIQDGDHASLVNKFAPKGGTIIGVTNPFFEKSCSHWPHVLSLGRKSTISTRSSMRPTGLEPGWKTKTHRRYISKDHALLKELESMCHSNDHSRLQASLLLRQHFHSRTTALLTPLSRYLNTLIPSPTELLRAKNKVNLSKFSWSTSSSSTSSLAAAATSIGGTNGLRLKPFNSDNFFSSLKVGGCTLPFKSTKGRVEFYGRWLKTPAFGLWLAQQEAIVQSVLNDRLLIDDR